MIESTVIPRVKSDPQLIANRHGGPALYRHIAIITILVCVDKRSVVSLVVYVYVVLIIDEELGEGIPDNLKLR